MFQERDIDGLLSGGFQEAEKVQIRRQLLEGKMKKTRSHRASTIKRLSFVDRIFRDRQIIHRCGGQVTQLSLKKRDQIAISVLGGLGLIWLGYSSVAQISYSKMIDARTSALHDTQLAYRQAISDLTLRDRKIELLASELQGYRTRLRNVAELNREFQSRIKGGDGTNDARELQVKLAQRISTLNEDLAERADALGDQLKELASVHQSDLLRLRKQNDALAATLYTMQREMDQAIRTRDEAQANELRMSRKIQSLEQRVRKAKLTERHLVGRLTDLAETSIENLEKAIKTTGLSLPKPKAPQEEESKGGPFIPYIAAPEAWTGPTSDALEDVEHQTARVLNLRRIVAELPLAKPVKEYVVTSSVGKRVDPLNRKLASHEGMDLGAATGTPVYAPGPGKVIFTGRKGAYGLLIRIQHANGLETRYAHLNKIEVKTGQTVSVGDRIGEVGSTGRSTGAHLHYEIRKNGEVLDPQHFIEAGSYVFKS